MTRANDAVVARWRRGARLVAVARAAQRLVTSQWLWVSLFPVGVALLFLDRAAPELKGTLSTGSIQTESGRAYLAPVPAHVGFPYYVQGSAVGTRASGPLRLFENGYPLGRPDALHSAIREKGGGDYSHWSDLLYFSSSDATDPRTNGRSYTYRVAAAMLPELRFAAYSALVLSVLGIAATGSRRHPAHGPTSGDGEQPFLRYLGAALATLGALGLVFLGLLAVFAGPRQAPIEPAAIVASQARGVVTRIDAKPSWPLRAAARPGSLDEGSAIRIIEDGLPLEIYETDPGALARLGAGRYMLLLDHLVFSARDGSDPRTNGRSYAWVLPVEVEPTAWFVSLLALVIGALLGLRRLLSSSTGWLLSSVAGERRLRVNALQALTVLALCGITAGIVLFRWGWGQSAYLGFKGYLPVSDALGYLWCAVIASGTEGLSAPMLAPDWCARRVLYVTSLGASLGLSGWRPQLVLLFQAFIIGGALAAFALAIARSYGRLVALVALAGMLVYAYELSLGNFMTEALGLPLGLLGISLLIAFATGPHRLFLLYAGLSVFSIGMFARMGALLVLPMLGLWACALLLFYARRRSPWIYLGAIAAVLAGPVLQILLVVALGVDPSNTGGNYANTLYGLSTGSRDWMQAYRDFAAEFQASSETAAFAKVYAAALSNLREHPGVFIQSLATNATNYLLNAFSIGALTPYNLPLSALCVAGLVWCFFHLRNPIATLPLALLLGEFLSVPLVYIGLSDHRVLTVSAGARFLLAGIGAAGLLSVIVAGLSSSMRRADATRMRPTEWGTALPTGLGSLLVVLAILPATPIQRLFLLPPVPSTGCPTGQTELVTRVGRESMALSVGARGNPLSGGTLGVDPVQLEFDEVKRASWWSKDLPELRTGTTLVYAVQLLPRARGAMVPLIFDGDVPRGNGAPISFCYDPAPTATTIGDAAIRRAVSARLLPASDDMAPR